MRVVEPPVVEATEPDYEDAPGIVRQRGEQWIIEVEDAKPICLPFEAPAEGRVDGVSIRFTLYLSGEESGRCRVVGTFVSLRAES